VYVWRLGGLAPDWETAQECSIQILIILPGLLAGTVHRVTQLYKTACREEQVRRERGKAPFCS